MMDKTPTSSSPEATPDSSITEGHADAPETGPVPSDAPLRPAGDRRVTSVDVLRGVAVLGILAMNIYAFAMPFQAYNNPLLWGGEDPLSLGVWFFTHLLFDQKFMPIFSMLFGAGLVLMWERAGERPMAGVWYRRELWLLVIGAIHGYLLWFGDILFTYAVLGMLIYPLRRAKPKTLFVTGAVLLLMGLPISTLTGINAGNTVEKAAELTARQEAGEELTEDEQSLLEGWREMQPMMAPTQEDVASEIEAYLGSYPEIVAHRAPFTLMMQTVLIFFFGIWRMGGLMLIGMGLMKLGVLSASRDDRCYLRLMGVGYGLGLPLVATSAYQLHAESWDPIFFQTAGVHWNYVGSVLMALGHVSMVMLACRRGWLSSLQERLSATGRMAFTNYLSQSVICTTLFYGYGFGLYGSFDRPAQMLVVLAVWSLQLWWSPLWLSTMRFGPAEWLWRTLTYAKVQPMRRS